MAVPVMDVLTPALVRRLLALADGPGVHGVYLVGSVARGEAGPWSDIDLHACVAAADQKWETRSDFLEGRLVTTASSTTGEMRAELAEPYRALWAVPALEDMCILLDRTGELAALQSEARAFRWEKVREPAAAAARQRIVAGAEYVFKIRGAMESRDELATLHAAAALRNRCTRDLVTARGVFIRTENEYFRRAQEAAGPRWAALHRAAFGLEGADAFGQAAAACRLYLETARVLDDVLDGDARAIVARAAALVK